MNRKTLAVKLAAIPVVLATTAGAAMAALPEAAATEIGNYKTDGLAALGLILAAGIAIWALKKLGAKFGWL